MVGVAVDTQKSKQIIEIRGLNHHFLFPMPTYRMTIASDAPFRYTLRYVYASIVDLFLGPRSGGEELASREDLLTTESIMTVFKSLQGQSTYSSASYTRYTATTGTVGARQPRY